MSRYVMSEEEADDYNDYQREREFGLNVPGINYHDRTSMEVTLECYRMAVEVLEKELGLVGSGVAQRHPSPEVSTGNSMPHCGLPSQPNSDSVAYITDQLKRMGAK